MGSVTIDKTVAIYGTVDISLKSSVVELLTGVRGALGSIHSPAIFCLFYDSPSFVIQKFKSWWIQLNIH